MSIIASASVPPAHRLNDAPTAELTIPVQQTADRFPVNAARRPQLLDGAEDRALWDSVPAAAAAAAGSTFVDGYARGYADAIGHAVASRPAPRNDAEKVCPPWCGQDHSGEETEFEGFTIGSIHTLDLAEITGKDPALYRRQSVAEVVVEMSSESGKVVDPTRVAVTFADPDDRTGTRIMGWTGTPEQVEALGMALIRAAQITRQDAS